MTDAHRRLVPVVVGGLAAGGLAAIAGNQPWASTPGSSSAATDPAFASSALGTADATAPPVTAVALVLLATWGVVLVSRGRWRVGVTWLGLVAAVALAGFAIGAWFDAPSSYAQALASSPATTRSPEVSRTFWSFVGVLAALAAIAASAFAARSVAGWPEMGRRYDAPGQDAGAARGSAPAPPVEEQTNLDLWRAIDEGRDPTRGPTSSGPLD